jgi:RNA polymerase subunit RPABC4/transcription elongation factor Spt4
MSKAHRGKGLREQASHGRGECPVCKRNNVKVLYEQEAGEQKFKICKTCKAAIKNGNKSLPVTASSAAPSDAKAAEAEPKETETKTAAAPAAETAAAEE